MGNGAAAAPGLPALGEFCFICQNSVTKDPVWSQIIRNHYDEQCQNVDEVYLWNSVQNEYNTRVRPLIAGNPEWTIASIHTHFKFHELSRKMMLATMKRELIDLRVTIYNSIYFTAPHDAQTDVVDGRFKRYIATVKHTLDLFKEEAK
jgi:hypothetical protein